MSFGGRTFRAFRPSEYGRQDEVEEDGQEAKLAKMQLYIRRAEEGLPLFEPAVVTKHVSPGRNFAV